MTNLPVPAAAPEQILVQLGDIAISAHWLVTPGGSHLLKGTEFTVLEYPRVELRIPVWAIVLAVLFFPLGLLFLLVKEQRMGGVVQVTAQNGGFAHVTQILITGPLSVSDVHGRANYARQLIAAIA
jgi:hypothetical protein